MALILPATVASGKSWSRVRALLRGGYDTTVLSMASEDMGRLDGAFSSDTGMLEVMLIARKRRRGDAPASPVFVTLRDRPLTPVEGAYMGESVRRLGGIKALEEGHGATPLMAGGRRIGHAATMDAEDAWPLVNVREPALVGAAHALRGHAPAMFAELGSLCEFGPDSQMLIGSAQRGPFAIRGLDRGGGGLPEYHALWNNDHKAQRTMLIEPDKAMDVRKGAADARVREMWATASHVHVNLDPRYTAQPLLASFVGVKAAGGTAWPSLLLPDADSGKAFVMWHNSTLGILSYWMAAGKQQLGRGRIKRGGAARIHVPDFTATGMRGSVRRLAAAFDKMSGAALSPISGLEVDAVRHRIDKAVATALGIRTASGGGGGGGAHGLVATGKGGIASVRLGALRQAMALEPVHTRSGRRQGAGARARSGRIAGARAVRPHLARLPIPPGTQVYRSGARTCRSGEGQAAGKERPVAAFSPASRGKDRPAWRGLCLAIRMRPPVHASRPCIPRLPPIPAPSQRRTARPLQAMRPWPAPPQLPLAPSTGLAVMPLADATMAGAAAAATAAGPLSSPSPSSPPSSPRQCFSSPFFPHAPTRMPDRPPPAAQHGAAPAGAASARRKAALACARARPASKDVESAA